MCTAPPTLSVVASGGGTVCLILGPVISGLWPKCRLVGVEALGVTLVVTLIIALVIALVVALVTGGNFWCRF